MGLPRGLTISDPNLIIAYIYVHSVGDNLMNNIIVVINGAGLCHCLANTMEH